MNKVNVLAHINSGMQAVLEKEKELAGDANDTSVGFEHMRLNYVEGRKYWSQDGPELTKVIDRTIEGPYGDIPVRFYYPTSQNNMPAIVYAHGGGFVLGNLDTHDRITRILAEKTGAVVVAVNYQLSPESKFPRAVHEVAAVAEHLHSQGDLYGINGDRLAFAGDSGGAHLGLAATFYLREEKQDNSFITCLLLFYGWFGLADSSTMRLYGGPWDGLTEEDWHFYLSQYANDPNELRESPYANCFKNDMSHDMPACYIAAAEYDPLLDDSITLAAMLEVCGVPFEYELFKGTIHAFLHYTRMLDEANEALEHSADFYRKQLEKKV